MAFLDQDDEFSSDFCEALYRKARRERADICKGECVIITPDGQRQQLRTNEGIRRLGSPLGFVFMWQCAIYSMQMLRAHAIGFDPRAGMSQDALFQHRALLACRRMALADQPCHCHYITPGSTSRQRLTAQRISEGIYSYTAIDGCQVSSE